MRKIISTEEKITISEGTPARVGTVEKSSGMQIEDNGTLCTAASPVNDCLATWAHCCTVALVGANGVKLALRHILAGTSTQRMNYCIVGTSNASHTKV